MKKLLIAKTLARNSLVPWIAIATVIVIWLAPITLFGRMPIGGDVTSFFLPLMAYYRRALLDARIPLWNELWGFGFPMLAESQAGVFYPPHLILFRLLETETAYSINIVLHYLLAGWFAYICGREFGLKRWGATLAGLVFSGNGFFIIHLPHQWSYTAGCWMPLAVALAWRAMRAGESGGGNSECGVRNAECGIGRKQSRVMMDQSRRQRIRAALGLALVLAMQMLAGHFQLAFYTQVVVLLLGLICTLQSIWGGRKRESHQQNQKRLQQQPTSPKQSAGTPQSILRTQDSVLSTRHPEGYTETTDQPLKGCETDSATVSASNTDSPSTTHAPLPTIHHSSLTPTRRPWASPSALVWCAIPVFVAFVLSAVQIIPTYELIRIALPEGRDFEYLSGFANTPFHLVSYLLPTLFHVNPLWRPVAWDPFHTSPEECFSYIGLLPICLAAGAAWRWRREPRVRLWVLLVVVTLLLSLGPYFPFFKGLIRLPGFSGFRSASRWSLATALFLSLLAGRALDGVRSVERLRLWLRRLVLAFVFFGGFCVVGAWVLVEGGSLPARSVWATTALQWADRIWQAISPWEDRNGLIGASRAAHEPTQDQRAVTALATLGYRVQAKPGEPMGWGPRGPGARVFTLAGEFKRIMLQELLPPVAVLGGLLGCLYFFPWSRSAPRWLLLALVAADLGAAAWLRPTDFAPRGRLVDQSPVLTYLAKHAHGQRVSDMHQNLVMIAGAAPANSYRTVDIPFATRLPKPDPSLDWPTWSARALDRTDVAWEILDADAQSMKGRPPLEGESDDELVDRVLARILYGRKFAEAFHQSASKFVIRKRNEHNLGHAWFWDSRQDTERFENLIDPEARGGRRPADMTYGWLYLSPATRVPRVSAEPELQEFEVEATGPGALVVSELAYPGWEARIGSPNRSTVPAQTMTAEAGCLIVRIAQPGTYRVELRFRSRSFEIGLAISVLGLAGWLMAILVVTPLKVRRTREQTARPPGTSGG